MGQNQNGYITCSFLESPKCKQKCLRHRCFPGDPLWRESKWLNHLCLLRVPSVGNESISYSCFPSWGALRGEESTWLVQHSVLKVPRMRGNQAATQPLPSRDPLSGQESNCPAFSGSPLLGGIKVAKKSLASKVGRTQTGYITPTPLGSPSWGGRNVDERSLPSRSPIVRGTQSGYMPS